MPDMNRFIAGKEHFSPYSARLYAVPGRPDSPPIRINIKVSALLKQQLAHNEISKLAEQGNELVKALRTRSGNYIRSIERKKAKFEQ